MYHKWLFLPFVILPTGYVTEPKTLTNLRVPANITNFPYAALLYREYADHKGDNMSTSCGSTIISKRVLITAAHCIKDSRIQYVFKIYVGSSERFGGTAIDVIKFKKHPWYPTLPLYSYDIAVVLTKTCIPMGVAVKPVSISDTYTTFTQGYVAGWGTAPYLNSDYDPFMKYLLVHYIETSLCERKIKGKLHESTFCAGTLNSNAFITMGESGSGLVVDNSKLIGLPAGMYSDYHTITVFTNVTYFYNWINRQIVKLMCNCSKPL